MTIIEYHQLLSVLTCELSAYLGHQPVRLSGINLLLARAGHISSILQLRCGA